MLYIFNFFLNQYFWVLVDDPVSLDSPENTPLILRYEYNSYTLFGDLRLSRVFLSSGIILRNICNKVSTNEIPTKTCKKATKKVIIFFMFYQQIYSRKKYDHKLLPTDINICRQFFKFKVSDQMTNIAKLWGYTSLSIPSCVLLFLTVKYLYFSSLRVNIILP